MLDPYHRWLAIPKDRRPPTHYQLLGVAPDEADAEVINEAALRQASHVRTYQTGPHADVCTRLLNEIAQARKTLLNPERRRDYDAQLAAPPTPPALPIVEVERVAWPPRPRKRAPFDGRDGLMLLFGAACMLVAQLLVWGAVGGLLWWVPSGIFQCGFRGGGEGPDQKGRSAGRGALLARGSALTGALFPRHSSSARRSRAVSARCFRASSTVIATRACSSRAHTRSSAAVERMTGAISTATTGLGA
jgi:hypothetical protein